MEFLALCEEFHGTMAAMRPPLLLIAPLVAVAAVAIGGGLQAVAQDMPLPTTQQVLLGAPDPAGPTARGVFLRDPDGQVERLAAVGHLVAWSVRTPADPLALSSDRRPVTFPTGSQVVIADERGGATLAVDFPGRWVHGLQAFRGPGGASEPRFAVESCTSKLDASCSVEVLALSPDAPLVLHSRTHDLLSNAAYAGRIDSGRRLVIGKRKGKGKGKHKACLPRLSVRTLGTSDERVLPPLPTRDESYPACDGIWAPFIYGRYAFASVWRSERKYDLTAEYVYGIDLSRAVPRWYLIHVPTTISGGSAGFAVGPAVTDHSVTWESLDSEGPSAYSLDQVDLPAGVQPAPKVPKPSPGLSPVAPEGKDGCAIAATDDAIYELANPRCAKAWPTSRSTGGEIRRVVHPEPLPAPAG